MIALYIIVSLTLLFLAVILIRAARFRPTAFDSTEVEGVLCDSELATRALSDMIACRTVSYNDKSLENEEEFVRYKEVLKAHFPTVFSSCELIEPSSRSILIRWRGRKNDSPTVLMAHYDVVSASESEWSRPAFSGLVENGFIWGRGALDTKCSMCGILCAGETLIKDGFVPENDIYLSFAGDEEIAGGGTPAIVSYLRENGISPSMVLDEGGAVVNNVFPGVSRPSALIGISEKGMLNLEYTVRSVGGHASAPKPNSPLSRLARALNKVEAKPFKFRITEPSKKLFNELARHSSFAYRIIFANLWCFAPILDLLTRRQGGELSALVRTTTAFTMAEGAGGANVIPAVARLVSNHRILPGESVDSAVKEIRNRIKDDTVELNILYGMDPSPISPTEGDAWEVIVRTARDSFGDIIVSPYLMLACSDSRHFSEICDRVYRFSPMLLTSEERASIHGNDERIAVSSLEKIVEFYTRLIKRR